jgi:predicted nicotinamide N-methyase
VIEQNTSIIANGTTGLHAWPACFRMIEYLEENSHLIENKRVLELGAGVGLLGLSCLKSNGIQQFTFTDSHEMVLKQIRDNCSYNGYTNVALLREHVVGTNDTDMIAICELNWTQASLSSLFKQNLQFDLILATGM